MADDEAPKGGKKKLFIIIGVAVVVLGGVGFFFLKPKPAPADASAATTSTTAAEGEVVPVDTMTVNLVGEPGKYARVGFALVLSSTASSSIVGKKVPLLQDALLSVMTGFNSSELQTKEGMDRLRQALTDKVVPMFPDGEVLRAVLTELIVQ